MGNECAAECKIGADRDEDGTLDVLYGISLTVWSDVVKQNQLRWVGHVLWKDGYWMKKCMSGRPKMWNQMVEMDMR